MITYQDIRRNMCEAEKIYANDKVSARRIEKKMREKINGNKLGAAITNGKSVALQLECEREKKHSDTWTNSQTAKKAGVGVGTVARYNKVMNSNDKMLNI